MEIKTTNTSTCDKWKCVDVLISIHPRMNEWIMIMRGRNWGYNTFIVCLDERVVPFNDVCGQDLNKDTLLLSQFHRHISRHRNAPPLNNTSQQYLWVLSITSQQSKAYWSGHITLSWLQRTNLIPPNGTIRHSAFKRNRGQERLHNEMAFMITVVGEARRMVQVTDTPISR